MAGAAVKEKQFVSSCFFNHCTCRRFDAEPTLRKAAAHIGILNRADDHASIIQAVGGRNGVYTIVSVQSHMVGQEKADRGAGDDIQRQDQFMAVKGRLSKNGHQAG
jgi:hypothetical protein